MYYTQRHDILLFSLCTKATYKKHRSIKTKVTLYLENNSF